MANLVVQFIGDTLRPPSSLSFGRNADLVLDGHNNYLHRRAGRFRLADGVWWLDNTGSRLRLKMLASTGAVLDLNAGASSPLLGDSGIVSLIAGPTRYELGYWLESDRPKTPIDPTLDEVGIETMTYGTILTPRERDFVVVLARSRLEGRGGALPTHTDIAATWGVSAKTVDNTLQRLRGKLRERKVRNIDSSEMLVEYLVTQGLVTSDDLAWARLDGPEEPRPSSARPDL